MLTFLFFLKRRKNLAQVLLNFPTLYIQIFTQILLTAVFYKISDFVLIKNAELFVKILFLYLLHIFQHDYKQYFYLNYRFKSFSSFMLPFSVFFL